MRKRISESRHRLSSRLEQFFRQLKGGRPSGEAGERHVGDCDVRFRPIRLPVERRLHLEVVLGDPGALLDPTRIQWINSAIPFGEAAKLLTVSDWTHFSCLPVVPQVFASRRSCRKCLFRYRHFHLSQRSNFPRFQVRPRRREARRNSLCKRPRRWR